MSIAFVKNGGTVTINRNPQYGSAFWSVRWNQYSMDTADGSRVTYDNGPEIIEGIIFFRNVDFTEGQDLYDFVTDTIVFSLNQFNVTNNTTNTDIGKGAGVNLTSCNWDGSPDLKGIFTLHKPRVWDIKFPYRFEV